MVATFIVWFVGFAGRFFRRIPFIFIGSLALSVVGFAQSNNTSIGNGLGIFKSLPPGQQRSILDALSNGSNGSNGNSSIQSGQTSSQQSSTNGQSPASPSVPLTEAQRRQTLFGARPLPQLQANDTLILSMQTKPYQIGTMQTSQSGKVLSAAQSSSANTAQQVGALVNGQNANLPAPQAQPSQSSQTNDNQLGPKAIYRSDAPQLGPNAPLMTITAEQEKRMLDKRERILRHNPYRLDTQGLLNIPGLDPIPLAGLSVEEATERLNADPMLQEFSIGVTLLPLNPVGADALKPYGYDLFTNSTSTFAPAMDIPVPASYIVGPGDTINVQLVGGVNDNYSLTVGRDGQVNFPELGPITVAGLGFERVQQLLQSRVAKQMIGTQASVTMGQLRSVQVFVLGEVQQPGSYTVSGLATITSVLSSSGGIKTIGSLRNIQLRRNGTTVATLDLYDLLLHGDARNDARVYAGDVIFVPPVGVTAGITGQVKRPAIYELKGSASVSDLIELSGGLTSDADGPLATLARIDTTRQRTTLDLDVTVQANRALPLRDGDILTIPLIRPTLQNSVVLDGYVFRPGTYQYRAGMRLADVLGNVDELKPNADMHYVLIRRELPPDRKIVAFSADLAAALANPGDINNISLEPRDRIYVFNLESGRDRFVIPLLREMQLQSTRDTPAQVVRVSGSVNVEGEYPLEPGMHISDLIRAAGGLSQSAFDQQAELIRYQVDKGEARQSRVFKVELAKIREGDQSSDLQLQPFDFLVIKQTPLWENNEYVEIEGEIRFPGKYPIAHGETLSSVLKRAGGMTDLAFPFGAAFTRIELKEREQKQVDDLTQRMQLDLAQVSLQTTQQSTGNAGQALAVGQSLLNSLKSAEPVGRLVIDVNAIQRGVSVGDIVLKDGDKLVVPRIKQEVTVIGEVQSVTSHLYEPGLSLSDYISKSGGFTRQADKKHVYVVRANGSVDAMSASWFGGDPRIRAGDTIVVPLNAYQIRPLTLWTSVTQIIYNLAIAAAAVNSF